VIAVLRLGHRPNRDKRITTHVGLVARAFGADTLYITTKDQHLEKSLRDVSHRFGGTFEIFSGIKPKPLITTWDGIIIHLTMYGEQLTSTFPKIPTHKNLLIIIGAEKVPPYYYQIADYNISIGNQPHSEVAALAIFLDRYNRGSWLTKEFKGGIKIIPTALGKHVENPKNEEPHE
jgi:tRNA (cytidine56-2'-O)-methyltransferase